MPLFVLMTKTMFSHLGINSFCPPSGVIAVACKAKPDVKYNNSKSECSVRYLVNNETEREKHRDRGADRPDNKEQRVLGG